MEKQKTLILLVGVPGSGKSAICKDYPNYVRINQDDQGKEHLRLFNAAISNGDNIIIDRMNFDKKQRNRYLSAAQQNGYHTIIKVLHVPRITCEDRCRARKDHPTVKTEQDIQEAIGFFFRKYERVEDSEADCVDRLGWDNSGIKVVVCDLDGTLANVEHRRPLVNPDTKSIDFKPHWAKFFREMVNDDVNLWCAELLYGMSERYPIIYATGRPYEYYKETLDWLDSNCLRFPGDNIFFRPLKDHRKDNIIKEIILEFEIKPRYDILFVVDDRKQVVDMWRHHGYTVLQCDNGDF